MLGSSSQLPQKPKRVYKKIACIKCDITITEQNISRHRTLHCEHCTTRLSAPCKQCSKSFANKYSLNRHIKNVHDNERLYPCNFTGCTAKPFKQNTHLKNHMKTIHNLTDGSSSDAPRPTRHAPPSPHNSQGSSDSSASGGSGSSGHHHATSSGRSSQTQQQQVTSRMSIEYLLNQNDNESGDDRLGRQQSYRRRPSSHSGR
jgi:C2H2-type zinc finger/Zinc finger, C2H2 type